MKKCGIFAFAALMTILCGRLNAAVESDIVGYTTTTVEGKKNGSSSWYQIAIQFKGLGEAEDKIKLGEAIDAQGLTPTAWRDRDSAPCIQVYNGTGYDLYYYISNAKTTDGTTIGWADRSQKLANDKYFLVGDAFWFKADNISTGMTATITVAGVVEVAQTTTEVEVGDGDFVLISNPYPIATKIKDIGCSFKATTWRDRDFAPCIQVYNGTGYNLYYYISNAKTTDGTTIGWADRSQKLATDEIPAGVGFWLKTSVGETGTLTFSLN